MTDDCRLVGSAWLRDRCLVPASRTGRESLSVLGRVSGSDFMSLELILHLRPREAGFEAVDTFTIDSGQSIHLTLNPGLDPVPATAAQLVNTIPTVIAAQPGLKTVKDLPPPAAWLGAVVLR